MKKSDFLDNLRVARPCSQEWNEMIGNDQVRFCMHCAKDVNDISSMTRKKARKLVRQSGGRLCIRYITHPQTAGPVFADDLVQIVRRAPRLATGVVSAALSFAGVAYGQADPAPPPAAVKVIGKSVPTTPAESKESEQTSLKAGTIMGVVTDPYGAVVPAITVTLLDDQNKTLRSTTSDENGKYVFTDVLPGTYSIAASRKFSGFKDALATNLIVDAGYIRSADIALELTETSVVVGDLVVSEPEYEGKLAKAVADDDIDEVRRLISAGENVNGREDDRTTPLFIAVNNGNREIVQLLLDFGAKVNARDDDKKTPLMELDDDASRELVEMLIRAGAKVNAVSKEGETALMLAAEYSTAEVVQALIDAGADLDLKNQDGATALMKAAGSDDLAKVQALVFAGADINARDEDDDNAWDYTGSDEIENFLVAHGIVVDPEDIEEVPPDDEPDDSVPNS